MAGRRLVISRIVSTAQHALITIKVHVKIVISHLSR